MSRLFIVAPAMAHLVLSLLLALPGVARAADTWVTLATVEIDAKSAGERTVALSAAAGSFRRVRITADGPIDILSATVQRANLPLPVTAGPLRLTPTRRSITVVDGPAVFLEKLTLNWAGTPAATRPVKLVVEGVQNELEAQAVRPPPPTRAVSADVDAPPGPSRGAADPPRGGSGAPLGSRAPASPAPGSAAPGPAVPRAPAPSAPTAGAEPPAAPAPTPAPRETAKRSVAPVAGRITPNVCAEQNICTMVEIFFGTDRNETEGPGRVSFGSERPNRLALGQALVTVPKTGRERGAIPRPTVWERYIRGVPAEGDPGIHFTIPAGGVRVYANEDEFVADAKKRIAAAGDFKDHAFIYVHGFAVSFDNALYRAAQISYDLSTDGTPFGTAFVYSWPSKGSILPTSYISDQDSADNATPHLQKFIELVTERTGVRNVHVIAHSMGNRVLMRTLEKIAARGTTARLNQIVLAAPDVDKQQFETIAAGIRPLATGMTLYASGSDSALALSRRLREGAPRAGEVTVPPGPAVVTGMHTIDITALSTSIFDYGHDTYADSKELLSDIASIFTQGPRSPEVRNPRFQLLQQGTLKYWRYVRP